MEFKQLPQTPLFNALSSTGKRIFLPQGIFYWAGLAKKESEINATIGSAKGSELNAELGIEAGSRPLFFIKSLKNYLGADIPADKVSGYAPIGGVPELRHAWKAWIVKKTGLVGKEDLLTLPAVTAGITNGIFLACKFFLGEGESIIVSNKHWGNYDTIINLNLGATLDNFNTFKDGKFDVDALVEKVKENVEKQGKAVVLLNFPNNPSGYTPGKDELSSIASALSGVAGELKKPVVVICDDAYEGYVYDPLAEKRSLFSFLVDKDPYLVPVKLDGASKELLFYGGRVGFITLGVSSQWNVDLDALKSEINNKIEGMLRSTISNTSHLPQMLVTRLMDDLETTLAERQKVIDVLAERWKVFSEKGKTLEKPDKGITFDPYQGGFFAFLNLPPEQPATKFARRLLDEQKVGTIPIEKPGIGVNGIRIAYCSMHADEIDKVIDAISKTLD